MFIDYEGSFFVSTDKCMSISSFVLDYLIILWFRTLRFY